MENWCGWREQKRFPCVFNAASQVRLRIWGQLEASSAGILNTK